MAWFLRPVWDMRAVNFLFTKAPWVAMASPTILGELELTEEITRGRVLFIFQGDIPDYFYRLRTPPVLWRYMVLPGISATEFAKYAATQGVTIELPPGARFVSNLPTRAGNALKPVTCGMGRSTTEISTTGTNPF